MNKSQEGRIQMRFLSMKKKMKILVRLITQPKAVFPIYQIKKGKLTDSTYNDLFHILNKRKYKQYLCMSQRIALEQLRNKNDRKIRIGFQTALLQTWVGDELVRLFASDYRFDVTVIITWQKNTNKEIEIELLKKHFEKLQVNTVFASGGVKPSDFDMIFYTSPYIESLDSFSAKDIPLRVLVCYIPYGFLLADLQEMQFNQFLHNIVWRNYSTSKIYQEMARKYCSIGEHGMTYSGYPKMDISYSEGAQGFKWKILANEKAVKKIIYAPHHSIITKPYYSTFAENKDFFLDYAKNHADSTSWVFKPHPLLKRSSVMAGVFNSEREYEEYVEEWNRLPNAVVENGEYMPIMASSDAMILDSVSFMCEYLYFHKPILFLTRSLGGVNEFGELVKSVLYQVPGDDFAGIKNFIESVIDNDYMEKLRNDLFENELDYRNDNGLTASEFIYKDVVKSLFGGCNEETI